MPYITVLRVDTSDGSALERGSAEEQRVIEEVLFGARKGVHLRRRSKVYYLVTNRSWSADGERCTGVLLKYREGVQTQLGTDQNGHPTSTPGGRKSRMNDDQSRFAYFPKRGVMVVEETSGIPYTRYETYARRVSEERATTAHLRLRPLTFHMNPIEALDEFESVRTLTFEYRHSQSPGNAAVDEYVDSTQAMSVRETLVAHHGQSLSTAGVKKSREEVLEHLKVNQRNGRVVIRGRRKGRAERMDTANAVVRLFHNNRPPGSNWFLDQARGALDEAQRLAPHAVLPVPRKPSPPPPPPPRRAPVPDDGDEDPRDD